MIAVDLEQKKRGWLARGFTDGLGQLSEDAAKALVKRIQAGDTDALGELYEQGRRQVERYVARRMVDLNDVEDVVQETFIRAPEMVKDFNPDTHEVGAWLCGRVARYTLTDYGRKDRFAKLSADEAAVGAAMENAHVGPGQSAHERESTPLSPRMVHALARLSPGQRQSMQLRFLDELNPEQAAEVASTSAGTVVQNCTEARKKLRAELADLAPVSTSALDGMSKKDAVLTALRTTDGDVPAALVWLREQGVAVDNSYVYGIRNGRRRVAAPAEIAPKSDAEIRAAEEEFARVSASRHATKKEVAVASARMYEARNGRLPSPADLSTLVEGVSMTTAIVALREARQGPAGGDAAAARGSAQYTASVAGAELPAVDKTDAQRQPKRARAYQAAQRFWSEHKELPTCDELAELAGISRGTCGNVLNEIRAAIAEAQPVPAQRTAHSDVTAQTDSAEDTRATTTSDQPVTKIPAPHAAEPDSPAEDRAMVALAASMRRTDDALRAAAEQVQRLDLGRAAAHRAEAEQERAQQMARWQAEDQAAELTNDERALSLAS